jgi:two-component system sensor histidine kinase KdpD
MLQRARAEEGTRGNGKRRGRLKLFFGYAAGVGKTYAMLQAARQQQAEGRDLVVGYVEPHGRRETEVLLEGLEQLPTASISYRGARLREFDLDAALARKPELILVDELAHTNAVGSRHVKRWQDVEELLAAGIDVYSTLNVQHIESLNDVVAQISGIVVRETIPDRVFDSVSDVVLVDLLPEELLDRLRQGKVYVPQQAARALERFFRPENLVALREIALRRTAERVHEEVESARLGTAASAPWPTNERLLVCVGPSPTSAKVVRAAKRLADRLDAPWVAVHVAPAAASLDPADEELVHRHLMLADRLGAEIARLTGDDVTTELLHYARRHNVTKIVLGKTDPPRSFWWHRRRSFVDRLIEASGEVDVVMVRGAGEPLAKPPRAESRRVGWKEWLGAAAALTVASAVAIAFHTWGFSEANLVMIYLLGVVISAVLFGRGPAIAASVGAVLLFDVLFTEPYLWVTVEDSQYLVTFLVMLSVGLISSTLAARIVRQAQAARDNQRRTEALYLLTRRLAGMSDTKQVVAESERSIAEVFDAYAVVFLPDQNGKILPILDDLHLFAASASEFAAAQWVFDHNQPAGAGTDTLPLAQALYLPLAVPSGVLGVLALQPGAEGGFRPLSDRHLLDTFASHVALAIERARLAEDARQSRLAAETEKLRSSLLSAVSHDIRTPLAGIAGASSTLATSYESLDSSTRNELLTTINEESERLSQLVENLLHMTRLSSGKVTIDRQWHPLEDVIGSTLGRMERQLEGRSVEVELDDDTTLGHFDSVLIEQLLVNLLDNAVKNSPPGAPIVVAAHATAAGVELQVADRGKGFASGDEERVFELFYRGIDCRPDRRGTGIGLPICRAIAEVHGGTIEARNRPGGGAIVRVAIPHAERPPPPLQVQNPKSTSP